MARLEEIRSELSQLVLFENSLQPTPSQETCFNLLFPDLAEVADIESDEEIKSKPNTEFSEDEFENVEWEEAENVSGNNSVEDDIIADCGLGSYAYNLEITLETSKVFILYFDLMIRGLKKQKKTKIF